MPCLIKVLEKEETTSRWRCPRWDLVLTSPVNRYTNDEINRKKSGAFNHNTSFAGGLIVLPDVCAAPECDDAGSSGSVCLEWNRRPSHRVKR